MTTEERRRAILTHALRLAERHGFEAVYRDELAAKAKVSPSLISKYWTAPQLREAILLAAIEQKNLGVLAQGLARRHPVARAAPLSLRRAAARKIVEEGRP